MLRGLLVALIALFASATAACARDVLSPAQFRDAGAEQIRAAEPNAQIEVLSEHLIRVTIPGDEIRSGMEVNFERAYDAYTAQPNRRDELLAQWVELALHQPLAEMSRDRLVVVLRGSELVRSYGVAMEQSGERLVSRPFVGDLHVVLAFDTGPAIAYAAASQIAELGLTEDEAWNVATANLDALMGDLRVAANADGVSYVDSESGLAPSFLMHSEVCSSGAAGDAILVTTRDGYVFGNGAAADRVRAMARIVIGPNRPESQTVLSCGSGQLTIEGD